MFRRNIRIKKNISNTKTKKRRLIILSIILFLILLIFSVIFSLFNIGRNKVIKGVKINNIDISGLTQEELKEKLENYVEELKNKEISVYYKELQESTMLGNFDFEIDKDKIIKEAISIGRSGNIIKDNYQILDTLLFGKNIEINIQINEQKFKLAVNELNNKMENVLQESNYYIEDNYLIIKKGKEGITIKEEEFKNSLQKLAQIGIKKVEIPVENKKPKEINIDEIQEEITKEAENAYISQNPTIVHTHINGVEFAITMEQAKKILEEEKEEYKIPLKITIPEITLEKLGKEAFPSKLGSFTTRYDASNKNRSTNLELASNKINGTIVLPGEIFSYNKVVGERTISQGYKEALVYSGGKVVEGIGGGICQISSTLYNAVIYANLEITSRSNHRFLTSYVTEGRDATVSWGTIDFCFKNSRNYPIKIVSTVKNGIATVEIYGMKEEKEYEVVLESSVKQVIPYTIKYIKDNSLKEGQEEIKQNGSNGAKSETYKILKYNGIVVSRTLLSEDSYSPLERIIKVKNIDEEQVDTQTQETGIIINKEELKGLNPELLENIKELE